MLAFCTGEKYEIAVKEFLVQLQTFALFDPLQQFVITFTTLFENLQSQVSQCLQISLVCDNIAGYR